MKTLKSILPETVVFTVTIAGIIYGVVSESFTVGIVCMTALAANIYNLIKND